MKATPLLVRPFRLCTTSFIVPDHIIPNVRKFGPFFDEIELLVFESMPKGVLPSRAEVQELLLISRDLDLTYNIHMPTDISLTDPSALHQAKAVDTLLQVMELLAPLTPTTFTLHLPMDKGMIAPSDLAAWETQARKGLELLVPFLSDPARICLETLWYAPGVVRRLATDFGLCLCIDAGHHFKYGHDLGTSFANAAHQIPIVHLHGVDFSGPVPKDHTSLDKLPSDLFALVVQLLAGYGGTVSLEVFNLENLTRSLALLSSVFADIPTLEASLEQGQRM